MFHAAFPPTWPSHPLRGGTIPPPLAEKWMGNPAPLLKDLQFIDWWIPDMEPSIAPQFIILSLIALLYYIALFAVMEFIADSRCAGV